MTTTIKKLLIANRGEIAVRVIRACRELGIATVAVYSEADRDGAARALADEADPDRARRRPPRATAHRRSPRRRRARAGADAIHPGYGFLSENARFAEACAAAGLIVHRPAAGGHPRHGRQDRRARRMRAAGRAGGARARRARSVRRRGARAGRGEVGYPVMLKAAAGGGGKGMRLVAAASGAARRRCAPRAREARRRVRRRAVYLERYVERPRHVEIQVLADAHGSVVHLGERECSIQRRHQKLVEESAVADRRRRSCARGWARRRCRGARAVGYVNAGTVEFLLDADGELLLPGDEHPAAGRASGDRAGHRASTWCASSCASRPASRSASTQADVTLARLRHRVPHQRGGSRSRASCPRPGTHHRAAPGRPGPACAVDSGVYEGYTVPRCTTTR